MRASLSSRREIKQAVTFEPFCCCYPVRLEFRTSFHLAFEQLRISWWGGMRRRRQTAVLGAAGARGLKAVLHPLQRQLPSKQDLSEW